jgi:pilus assembly protein CpaF
MVQALERREGIVNKPDVTVRVSQAKREKFSPGAFSAEIRLLDTMESKQQKNVAGNNGQTESEAQNTFNRLAEDVRTYLAMPRGASEEEKREYNARLNRAVLGYREDRDHLLAVINDRLIRQRVYSIAGYKHPYASLAEALFAEVIGMNVLELVLANRADLEEIQVVGTSIYEVRDGHSRRSLYAFESVHEVERIQQNLVLYNNDRINPRKRWAEVMMTDGTRVTMTGFGFSVQPTLTMRFYTVKQFNLAILATHQYDTMTERMGRMLRAILAARFNLILIGATNSGKTHLMKAMIGELPDDERLVTIETRRELNLHRDFPGKNAIEYETDDEDPLHHSTQAFKLALRQSPQRIINAEIRDDDANVYVRSCTRGHSGSMTTVHASSLEDVPDAITDMCMLDGRGMNPDRLRKRITDYVTQVGIEMRNMADGKRRIVRISELQWEHDGVMVYDWARYDEQIKDWIYPCRPSTKAMHILQLAGVADPFLEDKLPLRAGNAV